MNIVRNVLENVVGSLPKPSFSRVIFIYHDISAPQAPHYSPYYSTTPHHFNIHLDFIKSRFTIVPLNDLMENNLRRDREYAAITFDDGFESVLSNAFPLLTKSVPITVFLNSIAVQKNQLWLSNLEINKNDVNYLKSFFSCHRFDKIEWEQFYANPVPWVLDNFHKINLDALYDIPFNGPETYLDEKKIKYLINHGVKFGNHSKSHGILSNIKEESLISEIEQSQLYLESIVNERIDLFALPFGKKIHYTSRVMEVCRQSGHRYIFSSNPNFVTEDSDPIPRIGLANDSIRTIKFYLNRPRLKKIDL